MASAHPKRGLVAVVLFPLGAVLFGFFLIDPSILPSGGPASRGAALAFRDHVHETETPLTRTLVEPRLEELYRETVFVTEFERTWFGSEKKDEFVDRFNDLAKRFPYVDLYILAHTNSVIDWIEELPRGTREKVRFVYNSGCRCGRQGDRWMAAGADAYVAHPSAASHAGFFVFLLRRWTRGGPLSEAVRESNARQDRLFANLSVLGEGFAEARRRWLVSRAVIRGRADLVLGEGE